MAGGHESRASNVVQRILALDDETVERALNELTGSPQCVWRTKDLGLKKYAVPRRS